MKLIITILTFFTYIHTISAQSNSDSLGYKLLEIMNAKENYESITGMIMLEKESDFGMNKELFQQFFLDYFAFDSLKPNIVEVYENEFSLDEIQDLISFYETPLGKKLILKGPILSAKISRLVNKRVQETEPILFQKLKENYFEFLRDTTSEFNLDDKTFDEKTWEIIDTTISSTLIPSDCRKFREGKFIVKDDTTDMYIIRKDGIQHEIYEYLNFDMELKVEWLDECEYNLIFIKNKNKKLSYYDPGEIINVKITEIRGNEYDCIVKTKRGTIKSTLIKIE